MLYILPPPRAPNPPSPWDNIVKRGTWGNDSRRLRMKSLPNADGNGSQDDIVDTNRNPKSLSECYFAGKGTALVLPSAEAQKSSNRRQGATTTAVAAAATASPSSYTSSVSLTSSSAAITSQGSNIQKHLQSMFYLLRPEETLKMAVKLESVHPTRTRYLVVVSRMGQRAEESCLLGIDCNEKTTVGLVLRVMADTAIRLDGDGGFSVSVCGRHHIFKPVSVQAMWSALQTLHKVSSKAREQNYFQSGITHNWVNYYEDNIESERSCLNEWHAMDNLESKRPPSPDSIRTKPRERDETEKVIRTTLKEIMMSVDLDEVTSKYIRTRLEEDLDMDLGEYKSFIDHEMLTILGQMDAPTEIFEHVYLGSEWNASNYEELQRNGVGHILNVTREIDNFFPGTFNYLNVRVCDDEKTDLLKHWDDTFKYITKAKKNGSKVLVHCKMGISRSASVVIAYAMKAYNWDFQTAMHHVKEKRTCIKPNTNFLTQLETYQGILDAMKNKEKLQRSKSETNLNNDNNNQINNKQIEQKPMKILKNTTNKITTKSKKEITLLKDKSGFDLKQINKRPKSWSPDLNTKTLNKSPIFLSLEDLTQKLNNNNENNNTNNNNNRHVLMPCANGESYSVSPNQIVHLPGQVKERINNIENENNNNNKKEWDPGEVVFDNNNKLKISKVSDPFSNQLDKVFDREEKKQHRTTTIVVDEQQRELPSRQNSWSSYDSALGHDINNISRHSSWGSSDTRCLPSRNSSWGSYDIKLNNYNNENVKFGTVKRTKQKMELNSAISSSDLIDIPKKCNDLRLCVSAPETSIMELIKHEKTLSKSFNNIKKNDDLNTAGYVKNLKKEFEAKNASSTNEDTLSVCSESVKKKNNSLPSSPIFNNDKETNDFKNLIGLFENNTKMTQKSSATTLRYSCIEVSMDKLKKLKNDDKRPPISPPIPKANHQQSPGLMVAATVIAKAAKKQQQFGKTHPLARLNIKPRHQNPVYNTM